MHVCASGLKSYKQSYIIEGKENGVNINLSYLESGNTILEDSPTNKKGEKFTPGQFTT